MPTHQIASIRRQILFELLSLPTAPFAEHNVIAHIKRFCAARKGVRLTTDAVGNLLIRVRCGARKVTRPPCITAHLDHPGFVAEKMIGRRRLRAFWRGGVPKEYFVGTAVQFRVEDAWVPGTVRSITTKRVTGRDRVDQATITIDADVAPGAIGMWNLPDPRVRGSRIHARACDDLAGAASMLCCIDQLTKTRRSHDAYFLFTRAEEVGFIGAIAAAKGRTIPRKCYVVAMETSAELPSARMGNGPILRVGDRTSTFTPQVTAHCHLIARELESANSEFRYQRKLMDGGTCESSAYCTLGYEATGMCLALGNYHNVDSRRGRIRPEYVDLCDFDHVVDWFFALATTKRAYTGRDETLAPQLRSLDRTYKKLLHSTTQRAR